MVKQYIKDAAKLNRQQEGTENTRAVSFKEGYLDNLVDAMALLEVVEKLLAHHDDININRGAFMGLSILVEQIKTLISINGNILSDCVVQPKMAVTTKFDS